MKLSQFKFDLPLNLIAQNPTKRREDSRMMVVDRKSGHMENKHFRDILEYFDDKDVFVVNNTKVFPARMYGRKEKTGAKIEVFLLRELNKPNRLWDVIVDPARKIRVGNKLYFGENEELVAEVIDNTTSRGRTIRFLWDEDDESFKKMLEHLGETPLPKYIKRKPDEEDKERYQTVYAKHEGAVAAPTAGLHFSKELIKRCEILGIRFAEVTLHTGLGTFRPIEVEDLSKHKMDAEYYAIDEQACNIVNKAKETGAPHLLCRNNHHARHGKQFHRTEVIETKRRMDQPFYPSALQIQCGRQPGYQFSFTKNQPADHDLCICRLRPRNGSL
jgi:S-adenosylmethionine:tRNA ribosyltransferase-isomerase